MASASLGIRPSPAAADMLRGGEKNVLPLFWFSCDDARKTKLLTLLETLLRLVLYRISPWHLVTAMMRHWLTDFPKDLRSGDFEPTSADEMQKDDSVEVLEDAA